ncbi:MATE family efflux transporter [Actinomyces culturomici]|uniref:MATE family efflux transporter n=1 Tax=Actinomyces culturomici TaxID=1926276 RepID=UPI000E20AB69|nr:MATE family efflux transporter [Actinomyces culturomici]
MESRSVDAPDSTTPNLQGEVEGSRRGTGPTARRPAIAREILALAIPALGALVAEPLFTLIDSAMVGHLGTAQLAGLSLASQILQTAVVLFVFLAYSTTSLTARALGAGDRAGAVREGVSASWLAAGLGVAAASLLALTAPALVDPLTADAAVAHQAVLYLRASAPGLIGMLIGFSTVGTLRGLQDTRTPLVVTTLGAVVNVGLNALLMYGLRMGVAGSGLGTSIVQLFMAGVYLAILRSQARLEGVPLRPSASGIGRSARDGAPLVVRGLALRAAGLATILPVSRIDEAALASYQVVLAVWTLTAFVLDALAIAAQSLVGLALGRGKRDELRDLLRVLTVWGAGAGVVLGIAIAAASPWLPALFGSDPAIRPIATAGLLASCLGLPIAGIVFMLDGVLLGAGDNVFFAIAGPLQLLVLAPGLVLVDAARRAGASSAAVVAGAWIAYGLAYMGARLASNAWRTWRSATGPIPARG